MQYDDANPSTSPEQAWDHDRYLRQHSFSFIYNINSIAQEKLDRNQPRKYDLCDRNIPIPY